MRIPFTTPDSASVIDVPASTSSYLKVASSGYVAPVTEVKASIKFNPTSGDATQDHVIVTVIDGGSSDYDGAGGNDISIRVQKPNVTKNTITFTKDNNRLLVTMIPSTATLSNFVSLINTNFGPAASGRGDDAPALQAVLVDGSGTAGTLIIASINYTAFSGGVDNVTEELGNDLLVCITPENNIQAIISTNSLEATGADAEYLLPSGVTMMFWVKSKESLFLQSLIENTVKSGVQIYNFNPNTVSQPAVSGLSPQGLIGSAN